MNDIIIKDIINLLDNVDTIPGSSSRNLEVAIEILEAQLKKNTNEIRDYERIEEVISGIRAQSKELGLDPNSMEYLWRFLIELSIRYEIDHFDD